MGGGMPDSTAGLAGEGARAQGNAPSARRDPGARDVAANLDDPSVGRVLAARDGDTGRASRTGARVRRGTVQNATSVWGVVSLYGCRVDAPASQCAKRVRALAGAQAARGRREYGAGAWRDRLD